MIKPKTRVRMFFDYHSYVFSKNIFDMTYNIIINMVSNYVFFIGGTLYIIITRLGDIFINNGWIFPVIMYVIQFSVSMYRNVTDSVIKVYPHTDGISDVELSEKYENSGYKKLVREIEVGDKIEKITKSIYYFSSKKINEHLINIQLSNEDIKMKYKEEVEKKFKENISEKWDTLKMFLSNNYDNSLRKSSNFYNEKKFCLSNSLLFNKQGDLCTVGYHYGDYFSNYLTNIIAGRTIINVVKDVKTNLTSVDFPVNEKTKTLHRLEYSNMCNEVGVSILAIYKKDGKFILPIPIQNVRNQVGVNQRISSATGGADDTDLQNDNLLETVKYAMLRELHEEILPEYSHKFLLDNGETYITGYHRWINHGGKPEFTAVTFLSGVDHHKPNPDELALDKGRESDSQIEFEDVHELTELLRKTITRKNLSLSATTTINNLIDMIEKYPNVIDKALVNINEKIED